jgi:hypothetical protein
MKEATTVGVHGVVWAARCLGNRVVGSVASKVKDSSRQTVRIRHIVENAREPVVVVVAAGDVVCSVVVARSVIASRPTSWRRRVDRRRIGGSLRLVVLVDTPPALGTLRPLARPRAAAT